MNKVPITNNRTFVDKCFKDSSGKVVLGQTPNYPIIVWAICAILQMFTLPEQVLAVISYLGSSFLFYWAWLEITSGVNYFRKALGVVILFASVIALKV